MQDALKKTETPTEKLLRGDDIKCSLKTKLFQKVKFTLENEMAVILATMLMEQVTVTLLLMKIWRKYLCLDYIIIVL